MSSIEMLNQRDSNNSRQDVKMGTAESSQSSEMGAVAGLNNQSSFHRQSPNVARLIRSENSSKMEYEFPISDVPPTGSQHHHHHHHHHHHQQGTSGGTTNHSITPGNNNRHGYSPSNYNNPSNSSQQINNSSNNLGNYDSMPQSKIHSNHTSSLWISLTSCFGCRTRGSNSSSMNSLRDKVHAIRIVRASNDLTPAVFDSHYNIITLEQLRECDNSGSGNIISLPNDFSDSLPSHNSEPILPAQNGNGSVPSSSSTASSKKDNNPRIKKKKKKRATTSAYSSKAPYSDDDDDDEGSERT